MMNNHWLLDVADSGIKKSQWYFAHLCIITLALSVGCSSSDDPFPRFAFSGTVTFNGAPVPAGRVVIEPDEIAGNKGPQSILLIKDGKFDSTDGRGAIAGDVIIRVEGLDGKPDEVAGLPDGAPLFPPYEMKKSLPAESSTIEIEVPAKQDE